MRENPLKSNAFRNAALKSESYRAFGVLCLLGLLLVFVIVRGVATAQRGLLAAQLIVLLLVIVHELFILRAINTALKKESVVSSGHWILNVLIESQIPTVSLFVWMAAGSLKPHQVLVTPAVLIYFLLIILSTLRLSPLVSFLTGLLSTFGYLFAVFYTAMRFPNTGTPDALPTAVYFVYAGVIFASGVLAAVVARQIRTHVSAALREARLLSQLEQLNHDLDVARSIQQGLLPVQPPSLADFELAGWNKPADQTDGDYFDWQSLPDGRIAISLGDATGHGIGPALVMASCRAYARASLLTAEHQNGVLDRLNVLLTEDLPANRFVTYVVTLLNPATADVEVLSAGHGPILLYRRASDTFESLEAQGIPLGLMSGITYEHGTKGHLEAGDILVLITDGFYEWEDPDGEQFGIARLESVVRESRDSKPDEVIANLRSAVEIFCRGTKQQDDLTAVLLKRTVVKVDRQSESVTTKISTGRPPTPLLNVPELNGTFARG